MRDKWGLLAAWDAGYTTMDPRYEAAQLRLFGQLYARGLLVRGHKPVHW